MPKPTSCQSLLQTLEELREAKESVTPTLVKPFNCRKCGRITANQGGLCTRCLNVTEWMKK